MINVEKRIGSGELEAYLSSLHVPTCQASFKFGDFYFLGRGLDGMPIPVGIERKALKDFIDSAISGRLTKQIIGMLNTYQDIWIVVEGVWRADEHGIICVPKGKKGGKTLWEPLTLGNKSFMYRELETHVLTLEMKAGMRVRYTSNKVETCRFIAALYRWWTDKDWDQHRSHLRFHTETADAALLHKPGIKRRIAKEFAGVGWDKSGELALHFKSVRAMVQASEKELAEVPGVGKTLAARIVKEVSEES